MAWYRTGGGGVPASIKTDMNAVLNKKFSTATVYPPETWADTVNLLGKLPEATVSGTIAHFEDGADEVPIKSLVANIAPALEGVSSVEVVQAGKNLIVLSDEFYNQNQNCSWQYVDSGIEITASTVFGYARIGFVFYVKQGQTYTLSYKGYSDSNYRRVQLNSAISWSGFFYNQQITDTETEYRHTFTAQSNILFVAFYLTTDIYVGTMTINDFQLEIGATATAYEPYVEPTIHTVSLDRTVYGGSADIVTGEGESLCDKYNVTGQETGDFLAGTNNNGNRIGLSGFGLVQKPLYTGGVSNIGENKACLNSATWTIGSWCIYTDNKLYFVVPNEYTTFSEALQYLVQNNATFVFPLATTTSFIFTGQEINSLYGTNNIWNDTGDTSVTYRRDIELVLAGNGNAPLMMMAPRPTTIPETEAQPEEDPEEIE